jgi:hypothetical protein
MRQNIEDAEKEVRDDMRIYFGSFLIIIIGVAMQIAANAIAWAAARGLLN